jgi:hypothetical protein
MKKQSMAARIAVSLMTVGMLVGGARAAEDTSKNIDQPLAASVDLTQAKAVEIKDQSGASVLSGNFTKLKAKLAGTGTGKGVVEIELEQKSGFRRQELQADVEGLAPLAEFKLIVDGVEVATFMTDGEGHREMKYDRKDPVK